MKKANRFLAVLFAADLLALTNYREAVDSIARTFSFDEVLFYWFYLIPAAYLLGGYFLGQLLLLKGSVRLNVTVKTGFLAAVTALLAAYLAADILATIHNFFPVLPEHLSSRLGYLVMWVYNNCLPAFFVAGMILAVCAVSFRKGE